MSTLASLGIADPDAADPLDEEATGIESQESYADLRTRWGVDISEADSVDPSPCPSPSKRKGKMTAASAPHDDQPAVDFLVNDLKTITELRDKGESRRFHDEVGYLFEGLDPKSNISVRRAGFVFLPFCSDILNLLWQRLGDYYQAVRPRFRSESEGFRPPWSGVECLAQSWRRRWRPGI